MPLASLLRARVSDRSLHLSRRHDRFRILYVAKIDPTGQGLMLPPTAALVRAFIRRCAGPATPP